MTYLPQLLDAVKGVVAGIDFGLPTPEAAVVTRRYLPDDDLSALAVLHIDVSPARAEFELATRSEMEDQQTVWVAVRQKLPADVSAATEAGNAWIDARIGIVGKVIAAVGKADLTAGPGAPMASLTEAKVERYYDVEALRANGVFFCVAAFTFTRIH